MNWEEHLKQQSKIIGLLKALEIPLKSENDVMSHGYQGEIYIHINDLYEILTNEKKLRIVVSKLKNKAFW